MSSKRIVPGILFILIFILLYYTSYPSIGWWDSGSYASSAYNLSIPSQGGSILYVLLGRVFVSIFFFLPAVKAVTMLSIISTSLAAILFYFTMLSIFDNLPEIVPHEGKIVISFLTALSVPFLYSIWAESTVSRVYTLGLLLTGILIYCAVKIWFSEDEEEKTRLIFLTAFVLGIDFTAHRLNTPFIPVFLVLLIYPLRKELLQLRFWMLLLLMYLLGFSLNLLVLIRSSLHPILAMDDVKNFPQLLDWINMKHYGESNFSIIFHRRAPFWSYQINHMYLRYFGWNFAGTHADGTIFNISRLSYIPLLLGITGFVYSLVKKFKVWLLIFVAFFFFSFGLVVYSNTREGFDLLREIDRLFIPSFFIFLFWVGIGLYFLSGMLFKLMLKIKLQSKSAIIVLAFIGFVILPLNVNITNRRLCDRSGFYFPEDFAYNLLTGCKKNAILFTNGDNDTFPPWCLQSVEKVRPDIILINLSLLNTDFYIAQLQREYKLFSAGADVLDPDKLRPSLLKSPMEIRIPAYDAPGDTIKTEYEGRSFGKQQGILAQDKALISILENNGGKRPVYFSSTVDASSTVGLSDYLGTAGMVRMLTPVKGDSLLPKRLEDNLLRNYRYRNFNSRDVYADRETIPLFNNYRYLFLQLSRFYLNKGNKNKARQIFEAMNARLPEWRFTKEQNKYVQDFMKKMSLK